MTTAADILARLDTQLDDTIPCEWDCEQPAEWQITCIIGHHHRQHLFTCTPHKQQVEHHGGNCCTRRFTVESAVRIT